MELRIYVLEFIFGLYFDPFFQLIIDFLSPGKYSGEFFCGRHRLQFARQRRGYKNIVFFSRWNRLRERLSAVCGYDLRNTGSTLAARRAGCGQSVSASHSLAHNQTARGTDESTCVLCRTAHPFHDLSNLAPCLALAPTDTNLLKQSISITVELLYYVCNSNIEKSLFP